MTVERNTDYLASLTELQLEQFKRKDNFVKLLTALAGEVQEVEDMLFDVIEKTYLDNAEGAQLDVAGIRVNLARNGRTDAEYRSAIKTQIALNIAGGEVETIIHAIEFLTGEQVIAVREVAPAAIQIEVESPIEFPADVATVARRSKAAGVELISIVESGGEPDYTVANEAARLALISPPLVAGDLVEQTDTGSVYEFLGGDPSNPANWELVGPAFGLLDLADNSSAGEGLADLTDIIGTDYVGGGVLGDLIG